MIMKAISIKQPWASLIAHGIKDIENRTWKCPQKYIGQRVLIHASGCHGKKFEINLTDEQMKQAFPLISEKSTCHHRQCSNSRMRTEPSFSMGRERSLELGTEGCSSL